MRKSCGSGSAAQSGEHTDRGPAGVSVAVSWLAMSRCGLRAHWETIDKMTRDITLALHALSYVIRLHASRQSMVRPLSDAKSGGRFHPCRPGVEPRRCGVAA